MQAARKVKKRRSPTQNRQITRLKQKGRSKSILERLRVFFVVELKIIVGGINLTVDNKIVKIIKNYHFVISDDSRWGGLLWQQ